jgi:hypothetical protein
MLELWSIEGFVAVGAAWQSNNSQKVPHSKWKFISSVWSGSLACCGFSSFPFCHVQGMRIVTAFIHLVETSISSSGGCS